jgi:ribose transport system substrate-binding protein
MRKKQNFSALGLRSRRRLAFGALLLPLALSACSGPGDATEPSAGGSSTQGEVSQAAQDRVEKLKAVSDFVSPGPEVDVAGLAGKSVFVIPLLTTNDYNIQINAAMERAAEKADIQFEVYTNEGQPNQWVAGMNQAIAKDVDVIILSGGTDPRALEPQIQAARDQGIKVVVSMFWDTSAQFAPDCSGLSVDCVDGVDAIVAAPYQTATRLNADWIAVDSGGAAEILVVTSNDAGPSQGQEAAFKDEIASACPSCETTFANVPISKWTTSVQSTIQSELVRNPDIEYVVPLYDNMASYAVAGITAAGKQGQVKVVTFNGTPAVLSTMQDGDIVAMDVGESLEGAGFAAMDNAFRLMAGMEPSRVMDIVPVRIFDKSNVDDAGTPPEVNKGYGDDLEAKYLEIWGLG